MLFQSADSIARYVITLELHLALPLILTCSCQPSLSVPCVLLHTFGFEPDSFQSLTVSVMAKQLCIFSECSVLERSGSELALQGQSQRCKPC